jgi:hypothetical protein
MSEFSLSLPDLFNRAFRTQRGYDGSKLEQPNEATPVYEEADSTPAEGTEFVSVRNTLNAKLADGRPMFMPVRIGGVLLPNEPTIFLRKRKRIVETTLIGSVRRGTVKELITSDDWEVIIRGIAVNTESTLYYPEDQVKDLNDLDAREEALEIECALTSLLGIYRVVIFEVSFPEMVGIQHAQAYELRCISDEDFILEID